MTCKVASTATSLRVQQQPCPALLAGKLAAMGLGAIAVAESPRSPLYDESTEGGRMTGPLPVHTRPLTPMHAMRLRSIICTAHTAHGVGNFPALELRYVWPPSTAVTRRGWHCQLLLLVSGTG